MMNIATVVGVGVEVSLCLTQGDGRSGCRVLLDPEMAEDDYSLNNVAESGHGHP
jgi:hypothetical protein